MYPKDSVSAKTFLISRLCCSFRALDVRVVHGESLVKDGDCLWLGNSQVAIREDTYDDFLFGDGLLSSSPCLFQLQSGFDQGIHAFFNFASTEGWFQSWKRPTTADS